jgi:ArsR family metal-binding transcriptional regulator
MTEYIKFANHGEPIMTIHPDGKITLGEKADPTEAAAACVEAMSDMIQNLISNAVQADALELEIKRLREIVYNYVDPFDVTPEDEEFVRAAVNAVAVSHLQEYRK